jgi:hypothetical protein
MATATATATTMSTARQRDKGYLFSSTNVQQPRSRMCFQTEKTNTKIKTKLKREIHGRARQGKTRIPTYAILRYNGQYKTKEDNDKTIAKTNSTTTVHTTEARLKIGRDQTNTCKHKAKDKHKTRKKKTRRDETIMPKTSTRQEKRQDERRTSSQIQAQDQKKKTR